MLMWLFKVILARRTIKTMQHDKNIRNILWNQSCPWIFWAKIARFWLFLAHMHYFSIQILLIHIELCWYWHKISKCAPKTYEINKKKQFLVYNRAFQGWEIIKAKLFQKEFFQNVGTCRNSGGFYMVAGMLGHLLRYSTYAAISGYGLSANLNG